MNKLRHTLAAVTCALVCAVLLKGAPTVYSEATDTLPTAPLPDPAADVVEPEPALVAPAAESGAIYHIYLSSLMARPSTAPMGDSVEQQVIELTNALRAQAGCPALLPSAELYAAASTHSRDMATNNFVSHTGSDGSSPWERMRRAGYSYRRAAENIAAGQQTASQVVEAWYSSPGHRSNMLDCGLREIAVAYSDAPTSTYGRYWTQLFGAR